MEHRTTCSYDGCTRSPWWPGDGKFSGVDAFCIFHSPLSDKKRKEFKEAWEIFLANTFSDSRTITSLDCAGFIFPVQIELKNLIITGNADFSQTVFLKNASFDKTMFASADFSGARFESDSRFRKSSFAMPAVFKHTEFCDDVSFTNTRFIDEADFSNVSFFGNAHFTHAHFDGKTIFDDARFSRFGFFSDINLSCTTITFGSHARPYTRNKRRTSSHAFFSLSRLWNSFQKRHLKYKSAPILRFFL